MRLQAKTSLSRLLLAVLLLGATFASQAATKDPDELTSTQEAPLKKLFAEVDSRMDAALSEDPKQRAVMESELKALAAMPDGKARIEAGRAYRQRHAAYYGNALKRAGVDLAALARQMQQLLPGHTFRVTADHMILGQFGPMKPGNPAPPATAPTGSIRRLSLTPSDSGSCDGPGLSSFTNEQGRNTLTVGTGSAIAATCTQTAEFSARLDLQGLTSARAVVGYRADVDVQAVGALGLSMARARAGVLGHTLADTLSISAVAPLLWSAEDSRGRDVRLEAAIPVTSTAPIVFRGFVSTTGVAFSGSKAASRLGSIHATLLTTP